MLTDCVRLLLCLSVITVVRSLPYFQFPIAANAQLPDFEKQRRVAVFISDIFLGGGNCPPPPQKSYNSPPNGYQIVCSKSFLLGQ